jgi:DinB superfamily
VQTGSDRGEVDAELDEARARFHKLLASATDADLRRRSNGTRWTNEELLFHIVFGYMIVRALLVVVRLFGVLPPGASKAYARILDAGTRPFDVVNYWGSRAAATYYDRRRMGAKLDRVIASLHRSLHATSDAALARGMHFPTRWDPYFTDYMTLAEVYRYPMRHFEHHEAQLTLAPRSGS